MEKSTRSIAALGVNYIENVTISNDDILIRIPQENDRGLDILIEFKDENLACYTFSAQVKSGMSYFNKKGDRVQVASDYKHFNYWLNYNVYVILFVYNTEDGLCYWVDLSKYVGENIDNPSYRISTKDIHIFNKETYKDLIDYVKGIILGQKKDFFLSNVIRNIISFDSDTNSKRLLYNILNFRNEPVLWIIILYRLKNESNLEIIKVLINCLSYATGNPDIFWDKYNIIDNKVKDLLRDEFNFRASKQLFLKLLSSYDIEEYQRGELGQAVYHIIELCDKASIYLTDIIINGEYEDDIRYKAWLMYPVNLCDYDEKLKSKIKWLDMLVKQGVIEKELYEIFTEKLQNEGLFYYD